MRKSFNIQKAGHFPYKKLDTLHYAVFIKKIEVGPYIQNLLHSALNCDFIYKEETLRKKQYNLRYVFILKNPDFLRSAIFQGIFEIGGSEEKVLYAKTMHFALQFICKKQCTLHYVFIYKILTPCVTFFYAKKNVLCLTFLYLKFIL